MYVLICHKIIICVYLYTVMKSVYSRYLSNYLLNFTKKYLHFSSSKKITNCLILGAPCGFRRKPRGSYAILLNL